MNKKDLEDLILACTEDGMQEMRETNGSFRQRALVLDMQLGQHWLVIADTILHGSRMAKFLAAYAASIGGADAIIIQADARVKAMSDAKEIERVRAMAAQNKWIIADDPNNQEVFITFGRSREHVAGCSMAYSREESPTGDKIHFHEEKPRLVDNERQNITMIPNIWARVN